MDILFAYISIMEKVRLIRKRTENKISQKMIAEKLCMDVSCYNRREKG